MMRTSPREIELRRVLKQEIMGLYSAAEQLTYIQFLDGNFEEIIRRTYKIEDACNEIRSFTEGLGKIIRNNKAVIFQFPGVPSKPKKT